MRVYFDTEFIEDGKTIELISIGVVREDGMTLYLENGECDLTRADPWVRENVITKLGGDAFQVSRATIADCVRSFVGEKPEFWAYFADYDWVVLCQLYGRMIDLPKGWPMFCLDLKQELHRRGLEKPAELAMDNIHNALADALWAKRLHEWLAAQ